MDTMTSGPQPLYEGKHEKPKPNPRMELNQISSKPDFKLGDTVTLTITGKVENMRIDSYFEGNPYSLTLSGVTVGKKAE